MVGTALTLGRTSGAVLIGQTLDLRIPVRLDGGESAASLCFEADVFHADARVDKSKVQISSQPGPGPQDAQVRIRSTALIDEPVVTIYLRAGCDQKVTRRYVLLADLVSEVSAPSVGPASLPGSVLAASAPDSAAAAGSVGAPSSAARSPASASGRSTAAERRRQRREAAAAGTATVATATDDATPAAPVAARPVRSRAAAASVVKRQPETSRSRLRLDPLDLAAEREPMLRASTEMLSTPADNDARRAEAAALWRAINAQPQDILRDAQRLQTLEADVKALRSQSARNEASLKQLRGSLEQAESDKYLNWLVYVLVALLAAAAGVAGWLWRSLRSQGGMAVRTGSWWRRRAQRRNFLGDDDLDLGLDEAFHSRPPSPTLVRAGKGRGKAASSDTADLDVDLDLDDEPVVDKGRAKADSVAQAPRMPPRMDMPDFQVSLPGSSRAVNAEELFDIQQQADFFISLGQYDQAIEVLKNHISDNVETSALAYLDLLKIYHTLDRRSDYDALREDFNKVFNAQVPEFENFSNQSSGLEAYQSALSRIEALWPSPKVLEIIEESIFRKPGSGDGEAFDLEAYRELLLLYAMAKDVVDRRSDMMDFDLSGAGAITDRDEPAPATDFSATNIQPLSALIPKAAPSTRAQHSALGSLSTERSGPLTRTRDILHDDPFLEDSTPTDSVPGEPMVDIAFPDIAMPKPSPRLGLDIDLSEEAMLGLQPAEKPLQANILSDIPPVPQGVEIEMDIDFPFEPPAEAPQPQNKMADSHLLDFDLFDAATERDIAPRPSKLPKI